MSPIHYESLRLKSVIAYQSYLKEKQTEQNISPFQLIL